MHRVKNVMAGLAPAIHACFRPQITLSIFFLAALFSATSPLFTLPANAMSTVAFVGCIGGGMVDTPAPTGLPLQVALPAIEAAKMSLYVGEQLAVLGPKDWTCSGIQGTAGRSLFVYPPSKKPLNGQGIVLTEVFADPPRGVPFILSYAGRYFPYIVDRKYIDDFLAGSPNYRSMNNQKFIFPKLSGDRIIYLNHTMLEFQTPATYPGLGPSLYAISADYIGAQLKYSSTGLMRLVLDQGSAQALDTFTLALPKNLLSLTTPVISFEKACILKMQLNTTSPFCDVAATYPDSNN